MDSNLLNVFPSRLREIRGNTMQATFAKKIGISRASLSSYENGSRIPDIETLKHIHEETGVSLYYLLGLTDSRDDAFAINQRDTGLSEQALLYFANNPISAKVINHIVSCGAMKSFSERAAILHDDSLLIGNYQQHELSDATKALRDAIFFEVEKQMHALLSAVLIDDAFKTGSFGVDKTKLPSMICNLVEDIKKIYDNLDKIAPTNPEAADLKKDYQKIIKQMINC